MLIATERLRGEVAYREAEIAERLGQLAAQVTNDMRHLDPVVVPMHRGGRETSDELVRQFGLLQEPFNPPVAPMKVSRYDNGQAREPRVERPVEVDVAGRVVLLTDGIVEGGHSLDVAAADLRERQALKIVRLVLVKRASKGAMVDYVGFHYEGEEWLEGYGEDDGTGQGRDRRDIIVSFRQPSDLVA
ncbi:MAG TPA: phosphoribosyltransferase family protein [Candidatus Saccharimonadales bacterium]|nr:phosphoribosyltransferase family protein [Candidatus Saccharimonadales bacterium]